MNYTNKILSLIFRPFHAGCISKAFALFLYFFKLLAGNRLRAMLDMLYAFTNGYDNMHGVMPKFREIA